MKKDLNNYLEQTKESFEENVKKLDDLCELMDVSFQGSNIPEYKVDIVQELYILRYSYAYAYEYNLMYQEIIKQFKNNHSLNVLSIGCGPMTDYWALYDVLKNTDQKIQPDQFHYTGVDAVDWHHKFPKNSDYSYEFKTDNIVDYAEKDKDAGYGNIVDIDIFFFPKSICELSFSEINHLCTAIKKSGLGRDKVVLGVSLRNDIDNDRIDRVADAISGCGYHIANKVENPELESQGIITHSKWEFKYPDDIYAYLETLRDQCPKHETCPTTETECKKDLVRYPILKTDYINYKIITFERDQT